MKGLERILSGMLSISLVLAPEEVLSKNLKVAQNKTEKDKEQSDFYKKKLETINYENNFTATLDYNNDSDIDIRFEINNNNLYINWMSAFSDIQRGNINYSNFTGYGIAEVLNAKSPEQHEEKTYFILTPFYGFKTYLKSTDLALLELNSTTKEMEILVPKSKKEKLEISNKFYFDIKTKQFIREGEIELAAMVEIINRQDVVETIVRVYPLELEKKLEEFPLDDKLVDSATRFKVEETIKLGAETEYERNLITAIHNRIILDYLNKEKSEDKKEVSGFVAYTPEPEKKFEVKDLSLSKNQELKSEALTPPKNDDKKPEKKSNIWLYTGIGAGALLLGGATILIRNYVNSDNTTKQNENLPSINPVEGIQDVQGH